MFNWNQVELIDLIENYAQDENMLYGSGIIENEEDLSKQFDSEFEDFLIENRDDTVMINETFNNWTDSLCKDGILHPEQYNKYCYVGKYSREE